MTVIRLIQNAPETLLHIYECFDRFKGHEKLLGTVWYECSSQGFWKINNHPKTDKFNCIEY